MVHGRVCSYERETTIGRASSFGPFPLCVVLFAVFVDDGLLTLRAVDVSPISARTHTHTRRARATAPHRRRRKQAPEGVSARSGNIDTSFSRSRAEKVQAPSFKAGQWPRRTSRSFKAELKPDSIVFNGIGRLRRRLLELSATALRVNLAQCAAINRYNA